MTGSRTQQLTEAAKDLREQAADRLAETVETLKPHLAAAYENALELASEAGEQAKERALPLVSTGAAYAAEKAAEAKERAQEAADELSGRAKRRKQRRRRLVTFLTLGLVAAVAGFVAKKTLGSGDQWESRVEPTPPTPVPDPAPPTTPTPGVARTNGTDAHVGESAEDLAGETLNDPQN